MNQNRQVRRNRRRGRVISPSFQWRYAAIIAVAVAVASSVPSVLLFGILQDQARAMLIDPQNSSSRTGLALVLFCGGMSLVLGGIAAMASLVLTHRVCGPAFVLQNYFAELTAGRLPQVRALREADEFKELMAAFSGAVSAIERRQMAAGRCLDAILDDADAMAARPAEAKSIVASLHAKVEEARQHFICRVQPTKESCFEEATAPSLAGPQACGA